MLVEFKVGNFRSFKDMVTLSMVASADKEYRDTHTVKVDKKITLLKSAVIYGANASGKSNLFKAMAFMRDFVLNSFKESRANDNIEVEKFRLSTETENSPSSFEMIFYIENIRYRYGFQINEKEVYAEWLFYVPTSREATLFTREKNDFKLGADFKEGKGLKEKTRDNALFLSVVAQFNGEVAKKILDWFDNLRIISTICDSPWHASIMLKLDDDEYKEFCFKLLRLADWGIKEIQERENPSSKKGFHTQYSFGRTEKNETRIIAEKKIEVRTVHQKYDQDNKPVADEEFLFENESAGTLDFLVLTSHIYRAIKNGHVLVVDEFTSRLHPLLSRAIIEAFHLSQCELEKAGKLPSQAQLIFVSHDTSILKKQLFRRDQIWFTQKNEFGATDLYSLEEYRIRNDASFSKDYIMGKYGAVPFIGDIESLFSSQ